MKTKNIDLGRDVPSLETTKAGKIKETTKVDFPGLHLSGRENPDINSLDLPEEGLICFRYKLKRETTVHGDPQEKKDEGGAKHKDYDMDFICIEEVSPLGKGDKGLDDILDEFEKSQAPKTKAREKEEED